MPTLAKKLQQMALALLGVGVLTSAAHGLDVPVPNANPSNDSAPYATTLWSAFLTQHVNDDGLVDYISAKNDPNLLGFVTLLSKTDPTSMSDSNARKAYWINAYNALAIYAVCLRLPDDRLGQDAFSVIDQRIDDLPPNKGFFEGLRFDVAGQRYGLDEIEKRILLRKWNSVHPKKSSVYLYDAPDKADPRIHFALVCCALGCPKLQREAYCAERLDAQLDQATKAFFADPSQSRFDNHKKAWAVSELIRWYRSDFVDAGFANSEDTVLKLAANHVGDDSLAGSLRSDPWTVSYTKYNWKLNIWRR